MGQRRCKGLCNGKDWPFDLILLDYKQQRDPLYSIIIRYNPKRAVPSFLKKKYEHKKYCYRCTSIVLTSYFRFMLVWATLIRNNRL